MLYISGSNCKRKIFDLTAAPMESNCLSVTVMMGLQASAIASVLKSLLAAIQLKYNVDRRLYDRLPVLVLQD